MITTKHTITKHNRNIQFIGGGITRGPRGTIVANAVLNPRLFSFPSSCLDNDGKDGVTVYVREIQVLLDL